MGKKMLGKKMAGQKMAGQKNGWAKRCWAKKWLGKKMAAILHAVRNDALRYQPERISVRLGPHAMREPGANALRLIPRSQPRAVYFSAHTFFCPERPRSYNVVLTVAYARIPQLSLAAGR